MNLNPAHGKVYSIRRYVIMFVIDLRQVGGFIQVLQFPPPIKLTNLFIIVWSYSNILKRMVIVKKNHHYERNKQTPCASNHWRQKTIRYWVENPGPRLGQAQTCGRELINGIPLWKLDLQPQYRYKPTIKNLLRFA